MRIPRDVVFVSSVLFTIALLLPVPVMLENASTWRQSEFQVADGIWIQNFYALVGFASLANIFIGLMITWTGYINRVRSAWFVMFIIVWVWAFPVLLPYPLLWNILRTVDKDYLLLALREPGLARNYLRLVLAVLLMVIALFLPVKSFFWDKKSSGPAAS